MKIGIPRALLYYWYGHIWEDFLQNCGHDVIISDPTERRTISKGAIVGVDELCLPVKIFLGHICELIDRVDYILIPHLIKVEKSAYICPKFMGLPDIVVHAVPEVRSKMISLQVGPHEFDMIQCLKNLSNKMGWSQPTQITANLQTPGQRFLLENYLPVSTAKLKFGVIGHPYCLYDATFNLHLFDFLNNLGLTFLTPELTPPYYQGLGSGKLAKDLFWTIGKMQFDALEWMLTKERVDGVIQITPFACGPEAIVGDLLERRVKAAGVPYLKLSFEEHSGEAGVITRLEAFTDLVNYRSRVC